MIKKICNYSALLLLSMAMMANAVSAKAHASEPVRIEGKSFSFYNKFLSSKNPQAYSVTVKEGSETTIRINSKEGVSIKLYLPDGTVKEFENEKYFNFTFHVAGEYVVQLNSPIIAQYSMNVFSS